MNSPKMSRTPRQGIGRLVRSVSRLGLAALFAFTTFFTALGLGQLGIIPQLAPESASAICYPQGQIGQPCVEVPAGVAGFASSVIQFSPGLAPNIDCPPSYQPNWVDGTGVVLGPPDDPAADGSGPANIQSLSIGFPDGAGNPVLIVGFSVDGSGSGSPDNDLWVWETGIAAENYTVSVLLNGTTWRTIGTSNSSTFGSQGFNVDAAGVGPDDFFNQVMITSNQAVGGGCNHTYQRIVAGADIDAIAILTKAPVANDDVAEVPQGGEVDIPVLGNDDPDFGFVPEVTVPPTDGTAQVNPDGTITYTPDPDFVGEDTFTYEICNAADQCDTAIVTVTVEARETDLAVVKSVNPTTVNPGDVVTYTIAVTNLGSAPGEFDVEDARLVDVMPTELSSVTWSCAATAGSACDTPNGTGNIDTTYDILVGGIVTYTVNGIAQSPLIANAIENTATVSLDDATSGGAPITDSNLLNNEASAIAAVNHPPDAQDDNETTNEDTSLTSSVAGNDSDPDSDLLTYSNASDPVSGSVTLNSDGTYTYTPDPLYHGPDSFTYQVCDPDGLCDTATVFITVNSVNNPPIAGDDMFLTNEDIPVVNRVWDNDFDQDGDPLTFGNASDPAHGTVVLQPSGDFVYTPDPDYFGDDGFTYEACDNGTPSLCTTASVLIVISPINDPPVAVDDVNATLEDTPVDGTVAPNDTNDDGFGLEFMNPSDPPNGSVTLNLDGTYTYTPDPNFNGTDTFTYVVCDLMPECDTGLVTISVGAVNDPPDAVDDAETTAEDTPVNDTVATNDLNPDGDALTFVNASDPANGTVTLNPDGTYQYTPDLNFVGVDTFTYQACDATPLCDTATVTITVTPVNDPPVANDDLNTTTEDTPVSGSVAGNDTDPDNTPAQLTYTVGSLPANGTVVLDPDGDYTYTPGLNFNGVVTFTYQVCDPGSACDTATVTITVAPVNDPPVANDDTNATTEDTPVNGTVATNDTNPDSDLLTFGNASDPANGSVILNPDGTYQYTPDSNFNGVDTFTYQVCDPTMLCDAATVTITVAPANDPPVANDDVDTTAEDTPVTGNVLTNDTDPDNDPLGVATINNAPDHGTLDLLPDGSYTYTPDLNYTGTDTFVYQACDPSPSCDLATVTITITPVNDPPVAQDDTNSTDEDTPVSGTVATNDSDPDNTAAELTYGNASNPAGGSVTLDPDGSYDYTPDPGFNGVDTFTYEVCDPSDACDTATVTIDVGGVNDPPVAQDDNETTQEDTPVNGDVSTNDDDPDGDPLTFTNASDPANGTVTLNPDGTYEYTPDPNFNGPDTFTYDACDNGTPPLCDTAEVTITVSVVNDPPVAQDDAETTSEDTPVSDTVATNDSDPDNTAGELSWTLTVAPQHGSVVLQANGNYTYTPDTNYNGSDTFTYEVCDPSDACDTAVVTITINGVNDPPVAVDEGYTGSEDTPLGGDVSGNDTDPDTLPDNLTFGSPSDPANGSVVLNPDGSFVYTPDENYNGPDTFTYQVCDDSLPVALCDTGLVTIDVLPVNDPPVAEDDVNSTTEDTPVNGDVSTNDTDPDADPLAFGNPSDPAGGSVALAPDGTYTYTPDPGFNGADTFTYEVCDNGAPALCDTATVTITIGAENDPPDAVNDVATTDPAVPVDIPVLDNDTDPENDPLIVINVGDPSNGTATVNPLTNVVTYTPDDGFCGADEFNYTISDGNGGTDTASITVTVTCPPPPVAEDDADTTDEDTPVIIPVLDNDTPNDGSLIPTSVTDPANGTVTVNPDGTITYAPDPGYSGTDEFGYQLCNAVNVCDSAEVNIVVAAVNDEPDAVDDTATTNPGVPVSIPVLDNDTDPDNDPLVVTSVTDPAGGSTSINPQSGQVVYTPDAGFCGADSFFYFIADGNGGFATATITVTVPCPPAPVANDDSDSVDEDEPVIIPVLTNDTPNDGSLDPVITDQPDHGTVVVNPDGTITYTPDEDYNGPDEFEYELCDIYDQCDPATVTLEVIPVNDPPAAVDDSDATNEDTPVTIPVLDNDSDLDGDPLTVGTTTDPANGSIVVNPDGTITYTPDPNFNGTDTFTYEACDPDLECVTATVTVLVGSEFDPPVATDDPYTTAEDTPLLGNVGLNDTDPDTLPSNLTYEQLTQPANGTVAWFPTGQFVYTPDENYTGSDSFTYQVCDDSTPVALCDPATVTITITPVNDAPVAEVDSEATLEDTPVTIPVLNNDEDPEGATLVPAITTPPVNGDVTVNPDGTVTYTPDPNFTGTDTFTYEVCDNAQPALCDTAEVTVDVLPANDPPVAVDDTNSTPEDTPVDGDVSTNDTDVDSATLTFIKLTDPANGAVVFNNDGTYTYTPDPNFNGTDTFTYQVCDEVPSCDSATVTITVDPVNDAPVATDDNVTTPEDTPVDIPVLDNDDDPDNDPLTPTVITPPANGDVTVNPDGTITYTPDPNTGGPDTFTYEVCDDGDPALCDTATVTIDVTPVNDPPVALDDVNTTPEDTPVDGEVTPNDTDPDSPNLIITKETGPANGTVVFNLDDSYTYTPNPDFNGEDSFTYRVCDESIPEPLCDIAEVVITVGPVNDAPVAEDDTTTTGEDTPATIPVLTNDEDPDGDPLTPTITTPPANGDVTVNPDGTVTYTPDPGYNGPDTFTYEVCDNGDPALCDTAEVTITVDPVNDSPVAEDDSDTTPEDTPVTIPVLDNDSDPDNDPLTPTIVTQPANGTAVVNSDGTVTYTPNPDFNGEDTFTYEACDDSGACDEATVTIEVGPANDPPVANDDTGNTDEETPVTIPVLTNDSDTENDPLTPEIVTPPTNGTAVVNPDGTITYTPNPGTNGDDTFTYEVCDGAGDCDTATVVVTVNPVNDPPVAVDDVNSTAFETPVDGTVAPNDSDPDGDPLTFGNASDPANGSVTLNADGTYTYTPDAGFSGTDTFTYDVSDGNGGTDTATVTITIAEGLPPVAVDDSASTSAGGTVNGSVAVNDSDPDDPADDLTYAIATNPSNGTATVDPDGSYTYAPNGGFSGTDSFTYTVTDPLGHSSTATVTITVAPLDAPSMMLEKLASTAGPVEVGDAITYTFKLTNTGNTVINNIDIDDPKIGVFDCVDTLAIGAQATCTANYVVTSADAEAGNVHNLATATGQTPGGSPVTTTDENNVPACIPGSVRGTATPPLSGDVLALSIRALQSVDGTPEIEQPTEVVTEEPTEVVTEVPTEIATETPTDVVTEEPTETVTETATATETATETAVATETVEVTATTTVEPAPEGSPTAEMPEGCVTGPTPTPQPTATPTPRPSGPGGPGGPGNPGGGPGGAVPTIPPVKDLPSTGAIANGSEASDTAFTLLLILLAASSAAVAGGLAISRRLRTRSSS